MKHQVFLTDLEKSVNIREEEVVLLRVERCQFSKERRFFFHRLILGITPKGEHKLGEDLLDGGRNIKRGVILAAVIGSFYLLLHQFDAAVILRDPFAGVCPALGLFAVGDDQCFLLFLFLGCLISEVEMVGVGWSLAEHELQSFTARYYTFQAVFVGDLVFLPFLYLRWYDLETRVDLILAEGVLDVDGMLIIPDLSLLGMLDVLDAHLLIGTFYLQLLLFLEQHAVL